MLWKAGLNGLTNNHSPFIRFISAISVSSLFAGLRSHSHTVITSHPFSSSDMIAFRSLLLFLFILAIHHSVLVLGMMKYWQLSCPCQKHPCMKTTFLYFGKTRSGLPGSLLSCSLYLKLLAKRNFLTRISGRVFLPLIWLILKLRVSLEWTSLTVEWRLVFIFDLVKVNKSITI